MLLKNKRPSKDMADWEKKSLHLSHHPRKRDSKGGRGGGGGAGRCETGEN
jgi:hypothetical protein